MASQRLCPNLIPHSAIRIPHSRSGVSVLEVLISIGVASVGLLGVILLIPLADYQMNRGLVLERANQVGVEGVHQMQIIGATNPNNWRKITGAVPPVIAPPLLTNDPHDVDFPALAALRVAFCIDPEFVAANGASTIAGAADARKFPYVVDTTITPPHYLFDMVRITLPAAPGSPLAMGADQATLLFTAQDDLEFRRPTDDRTLPPVQRNKIGGDQDTDGDGDIDGDWNPMSATLSDFEMSRKATGRLSWMATIVPHEKVGPSSDEYILSIVVFHQRDPSFSMTPAPNESANERVLQIPHFPNSTPPFTGFVAGGVGGGDVMLMPRTSLLPLTYDDALLELDVKAGDWVLLSRRNEYLKRIDTSTNPDTLIYGEAPQTHRWYRVVAADNDIIDSGNVAGAPGGSWIRFVTLDGPDWNPSPPPSANRPYGGINQVTVVKNVVAVYEKTIRLETSSFWTN